MIINWKNFQSHLIRKAESNQDEWDLEEDLEDEEMACKLPVMDPWDPMIIPYLEPNLDGFKCRIVQPYFTYVDQYNYLRRNESEIAAYERSTNDVVHCIYQTFERGNTKDDDSVQFDTEHKLRKVTCFDL